MVDVLAHYASTRCLNTGIHQAVSTAHNSAAIWVSECLCQKSTYCVLENQMQKSMKAVDVVATRAGALQGMLG